MVQKKRGLGRGLQALIPEVQEENPARPSDVFFPPHSPARSAQTHTNAGADKENSHAAKIASTLLATPKRMQKNSALSADVSRETSAETLSKKSKTAKHSHKTANSPQPSAGTEPELVPVPGTTFAELPITLITANPRQPRQNFDEDDIAELASSIKEVGLLQPVVVRRIDDAAAVDALAHYELIMGERRLRAAKLAGLKKIPALVRYTADEDLLRDALLENLHRVQLNPLEEAAAYQQLLDDFNCTHAELSQRISRSRSQISNMLRLMKLPPLVQRRLAAGVISVGHARALLGLPDPAAMERYAQRIVAEGLSVRATEELVALHEDSQTSSPKPSPKRHKTKTLTQLSSQLSDIFDTRVKVTRGAKKGRISIEFAGEDDLTRLVAALAPSLQADAD